jgi:hypothetical protein
MASPSFVLSAARSGQKRQARASGPASDTEAGRLRQAEQAQDHDDRADEKRMLYTAIS